MRIFSNFDTKLKKRSLTRYQEQYGKENVVFLSKSYLFGFVKVFLPLYSLLFVFIVLFIFLYIYFGIGVVLSIWLPMLWITLLFVAKWLIKNYIEYVMDFSIVTPNLLITYDQQGVLNRYVRTINAVSIKTISVVKEWLLYSFFNNWDLVFLSEGWDIENGETVLHYIYKPERKRHAISKILWRN